MILVIIAWRWIEYQFAIISPYLPKNVSPRSRTDLFLDYILWGSFAASIYRDEKWQILLKNWLKPWSWLLFFRLFVFIFLYKIPLIDTIRAFLIQLMLLSTIINPNSKWTYLFETKILIWIGRLSYSLSIWQQFFW